MCWHSIQRSQINIDHDLVATNQIDSALYELNGDCGISDCEFLCVRHINKLAIDLPSLQICGTGVICGCILRTPNNYGAAPFCFANSLRNALSLSAT